jgi:hypothetical protein
VAFRSDMADEYIHWITRAINKDNTTGSLLYTASVSYTILSLKTNNEE